MAVLEKRMISSEISPAKQHSKLVPKRITPKIMKIIEE